MNGFCIKIDILYSLVLFILQQIPLSCCLTPKNLNSCYSVLGHFTLPQQILPLPFLCTVYNETTFENHRWLTQISPPATIYQHSKIKVLCYFEMSWSFNPTTQCHITADHNPQISPCLLTLYFLPYREATWLIKYGSQERVSSGAQLCSNEGSMNSLIWDLTDMCYGKQGSKYSWKDDT